MAFDIAAGLHIWPAFPALAQGGFLSISMPTTYRQRRWQCWSGPGGRQKQPGRQGLGSGSPVRLGKTLLEAPVPLVPVPGCELRHRRYRCDWQQLGPGHLLNETRLCFFFLRHRRLCYNFHPGILAGREPQAPVRGIEELRQGSSAASRLGGAAAEVLPGPTWGQPAAGRYSGSDTFECTMFYGVDLLGLALVGVILQICLGSRPRPTPRGAPLELPTAAMARAPECGPLAAAEEGMAEPLCPEALLVAAGSPAAASVEEAEHGGLLAAAAARRARPGASRRGRVLGTAAALCVALAVALLAKQWARSRRAASADTGETTGLFLFGALAGAAEVMLTGAKAAKAIGGGYKDFNGLLNNSDMSKEISTLEAMLKVGVNKSIVLDPSWKKFLPNETQGMNESQMRAMLFPRLQRHDGNLCYDDEEEHAGLCYKRCELLTFGTHPFRTSAFSCCRSAPCDWDRTAFKMGICGGYSVSGDTANGMCPHTPGACLANEELLNGLCYKKCAILTVGEYMYRTGPSTCCKFRSQLACTAGAKGPGGNYAIVNTSFATGGGLCTKEMPCTVHMPLVRMSENKEWFPWDNITNITGQDALESGTTTEEAARRQLDDTTLADEEEEAVGAPAGAADNLAAAIAAEKKAIAVMQEAVKAAKEAAAVAKAQAAPSAAESERLDAALSAAEAAAEGQLSERGSTLETPAAVAETPTEEVAALKK
ncbi:unnamed protein product [Prorocentrum cordatum]|uniref:H(+)-exporting diphosphatase n=1 Tax=Prorocentrum cordatum TaxID=2364126 RepID=A0ABN9QW87_9DINO|nr:unnamed protein product [Polarella glacialis]